MSGAASTLIHFNPDAKSGLHHDRHTTDFHPSLWKDYFLQFASESKHIPEDHHGSGPQIEKLKKKVVKMLASTTKKLLEKVNLIDTICRLGLHYHFEHEIDTLLLQIYKNHVENGEIAIEDNLRSIALLFRLLRQEGYGISPNAFNKFKDVNGNFIESLTRDVEGMLSLYEASHLRVNGEDILDEALVFTSTHLESIATQLNPFLAAQVNHSLSQPLHLGLPRLEARNYISIYQQDPTCNEILLALAKLDFNMLQQLHQKEVGYICKWWKELEVTTKLAFARDRVVECCYWIFGVYFEPQYSQARKLMMKVIAVLSIIDDTYDAYGTIDELELFTKAVERWDISCVDDLPQYMKLTYKTLLKVYEEAEQEIKKEGRSYSIRYGIQENVRSKVIADRCIKMKKTVQAYMTEARWLNSNYIPTTTEYINTSTISCCYPLLITTSFIGMGDIATEDVFKWVTSKPKIVKASSIICRLMDDIVSNEFEQKRGHVVSILECYMKEFGVSRQEAVQECRKRVVDTWKDINEEFLRPTKVPMAFLMRVLNITRYMDVMYKEEDTYTHAGGIMKKYIETSLIDQVPI